MSIIKSCMRLRIIAHFEHHRVLIDEQFPHNALYINLVIVLNNYFQLTMNLFVTCIQFHHLAQPNRPAKKVAVIIDDQSTRGTSRH